MGYNYLCPMLQTNTARFISFSRGCSKFQACRDWGGGGRQRGYLTPLPGEKGM